MNSSLFVNNEVLTSSAGSC